MPKSYEWLTYAKWSKIYDPDILYMNVAGQNMIILNSLSATKELLERRSSLYSSKPRLPMLCELVGWGFAFVFMRYGSTWRKHRKLMHQSFRPSVVSKFNSHIMKSTHTFLRNLLAEPEDYEYHLRHMAAELILLITYGIQIQPGHHPFVETVERALVTMNECTIPGRFLVDFLPWLKYVPEWMPFANFKRLAKEYKTYATDTLELPYRAVCDDILAGRGIDSFVADGLRSIGETEDLKEAETVVKSVAGMMYIGKSSITVVTILNGILALMCHPEVFKKAQAEIDTVIQPGSLPDFKQKNSLPYLSAVIKEIWRWSPVVPVVVHFNESEDAYKGYRVPAQSVVIGNMWAMLHDEEVYTDPSTFDPERFIKDGKINEEVRDPENIVFGFGRRDCPGKHFGSLSVWMTMACLISLFDISKPIDKNGETIEPTLEWSSAGISRPAPFKCKIVPRSEQAAAIIRSTEAYEYFTK
ncbi:hypothetical protein AX16_005932 [Volvariella volvacea WC 439]|nr:hypothetical protein AX16_005932 [Volvariella volvacea WC 439]